VRRRRRVVAVSLGQAHSCLLTDDGRLWMLGLRGRGVLFDGGAGAGAGGSGSGSAGGSGAGAGVEEEELPEVLMQTEPLAVAPGPLAGLRVVALRCGLHHCYALTDEGRVFKWGWRGRVAEVLLGAGAEGAGAGAGAGAGEGERAARALRVREFSEGFCHSVMLVE
jgi:alpha-tubulin suppressor-like RCC1 family protein